MLLSITEFIGHLHPAVIHLPIGILLTALLLQWLARNEKHKALKPAIPIALLAGALSALISCITGYVLSIAGEYDKNLAAWHMWMGICTAFLSFLLYAKEKNPLFKANKTLLSLGLLALLFVTGHLGGSLTHGSDYFTKPLTSIFSSGTAATIKPIGNVQEADVYADIAAPILQTRCYSCHGPNKQKGGLRLDDSVVIMKGGKDGVVVKPGKGGASELVKRMMLPLNDDDHMPPKEKAQPTTEQIALLHWWIDNGAVFTGKVKQLNQPQNIKPALLALQKAVSASEKTDDVPAGAAPPADNAVIKTLLGMGVVVVPVAQNSNYLLVNFVNDSIVTNEALQLLVRLKKQVAWLKLNNTNLGDSAMHYIGQLTALTRLDVAHTQVTDNGLPALQALQNLHYLNLAATAITGRGLLRLKTLPQLHSVYLYQTHVTRAEYGQLKVAFPKTSIDSGGYVVPLFVTDTTEVKAKKEY